MQNISKSWPAKKRFFKFLNKQIRWKKLKDNDYLTFWWLFASSFTADTTIARLINRWTIFEKKARRWRLLESEPSTPDHWFAETETFFFWLSCFKVIKNSRAFSRNPTLWLFRLAVFRSGQTIAANWSVDVRAVEEELTVFYIGSEREKLAGGCDFAKVETLEFVLDKVAGDWLAFATLARLKAGIRCHRKTWKLKENSYSQRPLLGLKPLLKSDPYFEVVP